MANKMDRREFIKITGLGVGGMAASASMLQAFNPFEIDPAQILSTGIPEVTPTYCEICFWKCAGWVHKKDGEAWKIIGNPDDPHSNGRFCPRGTGGVGAYTDPDRLKTPLIRVEERGKQVFREASWDEAFDYIVDKMKVIEKEHGPECMALFTHGSGGSYFKNMLRAFGSNNIAAPSYAQCRGPREEAYMLTFGETVGSPERTDMQNSKCIVLIGSHLGENMHNGQVQEFTEAIAGGASVITVDPRFSTAASKSKYWLPIKPATDLALMLAWINVIIEEELYDKKYVEQYTYGFEELKKSVKKNTPEWAYPITTIKPHIIRETAREMAKNAPATLIHPGRHVTWYGDDTQRVRAGAILNALLGSWGRRGGFYSPAKASVKKPKTPKYPKPRKDWRDAFPGQFPLANLAISQGICDATIPSLTRDCDIKGWFVYGTNLLFTLPQPEKTLKAIQALDLLVAIDIMPAEITGYADVVLPECTYLERYDDLRVSPGREPNVALRAPAFEPKYDTKPAYWMAREIAKRLDLGHYFPHETMESYLDERLKSIGSSLEEMKKLGVKHLPNNENELYYLDGEEFEFATNTGKIELYSTALAETGFDPIPKFTKHEEPEDGYYRLIYGRAPMHTFGRTTNNPNLADLMPENEVWINPKVAKEWDIKNREYVVLENQDGAVCNKVRAKVTERIRHDCVYMVHGFGHSQKQMPRSFLKGANDTDLITKIKVDPIMGGTGMRTNFVTFKKEVA
ncbi:MAG: nitrate reductase [Calditrichaeota bacterium]|nr:MAG: nitrate reductase [Calditrichota bacterium]MBL1206392.1 nitrate reductase [Calditrichota bacterium]NOG46218.1 molybdopterin-dependent oxidoreductase [Calditrichota bacterium]